MTQQTTLDRDRTAVLIMDFQNRIVNNYAGEQGVVERASNVLETARRVGIPVIYVVHRGGDFKEASSDTEIHPGVAPAPGELVLAKIKTSPFSSTGIDVLLREMGRDTLVLMGVATSGCVLSTARWAADLNYRLVVVADACSDRDPEVHRVLTEKVFPRQATVLSASDFSRSVGLA